jgi:general secretion pathway protein L
LKRGRVVSSLPDADNGSDPLDALSQIAKARPGAKIDLLLPLAACFERRIEIPATAERQGRSILALDFERSTPFKLSDVYTGHTFVPSKDRKGWLSASQFVVKRKFVDRTIESIEALGLKVDRLDVWNADGQTPVGLNFFDRSGDAAPSSASRRPRLLMSAVVLGLAVSALWMDLSRREAALAALELDVSAARQKAEVLRNERTVAEVARKDSDAVRAYKSGQLPSVEILDQMTRLLPDDVFLNDVTIEGDLVDVSGQAKSSSAVISLLERSPAFKDATFTSPVTFDANADKERFSLRLRLRQSSRTAAVPGAEAEKAVP